MILTLEDVALRLFEEHGFAEVTVDQIASEAKISPRTFYRYFPAKEDVLQLSIDRRSDALRTALAARPDDEPPLQSLRLALEQELSTEDMVMLRRWIGVVAATPSVLRSVVGGIQLKSYRVMAEFFGSRLGMPGEALVPTMLAAAAGGVIQAAHTHWFFNGGDLPTTISESIAVLESGFGRDPRTWPVDTPQAQGPGPAKTAESAKTTKTTKTAKTAKPAKTAKTTKSAKSAKSAGSAGSAKPAKTTKTAKPAKRRKGAKT
ncbi:MAG: TetR family transcriptional regulator [Acidimicrobiales bacterium]|jgi:AcrR family transcriptional regulator